MYCRYIKRILSILCSFTAILILIPIFLVVAVMVWIQLGKPILFTQSRVSKNNRIFKIYKFRTMKEIKDENGNLLPYELRITKFGNILRSSSLDELPELINILKGDLSFVGPRPLVAAYLPLYTKYERQRLNVRSGLIPPEVLYKNVTPTWEQQFEYEVNYALNVSFLLDLKIIIATFKSLLKRNTINYGNYNRDSFFEKRFHEERENQENQELINDKNLE